MVHGKGLVLFLGDIVFLALALWLTLLARYFAVPSPEVFLAHIVPFSFLFGVWIFVYFLAGLYEKHAIVLKSALPNTILRAQIINSVIAVLFFYFIPYFGITPKTILFIDLVFSFGLILLWRLRLASFLKARKKEKAILIGTSREVKRIKEEVARNPSCNFSFVSTIDLDQTTGVDFLDEIMKEVYTQGVSIIIIDLANEKVLPILSHLYNLIFSRVRFVDIHDVYEDMFNSIPVDSLHYNWFLEHISCVPHAGYDVLKRAMDIFIALFAGIFSLVAYPFVFLAIFLDDAGPFFSRQARVGKGNRLIRLLKFRTMDFDDNGKWNEEGAKNEVTRIGDFLRKTRIDELPQLWNVIKGDISLIGPRPEFFDAVKVYEKRIPYYNMRHLIKPGLSGWAQIYHAEHPHHGIDIDATKEKLSYDLYYVKNRSFLLDIKIALKTITILLSRSGR